MQQEISLALALMSALLCIGALSLSPITVSLVEASEGHCLPEPKPLYFSYTALLGL